MSPTKRGMQLVNALTVELLSGVPTLVDLLKT